MMEANLTLPGVTFLPIAILYSMTGHGGVSYRVHGQLAGSIFHVW